MMIRLLYADAISLFATRKFQKIQKIDIDEKNLRILQSEPFG